MSALCSLLGIDIPILQAPTGSVAGPELAAAVSGAGALGSLGLTWTSETDAADSLRSIRRSTHRPFLVNYALAFEPRTLDLALDLGAPVVSFSWGEPGALIDRVHATGALVGVQVANAEGARNALGSGADFLICQGVEAGGHVQSTRALRDVLAQVARVAGNRAPLVAAGGIATGQEIADALRAGASGVMLGTRFVATRESRAHLDYKRRLLEAGEGATALTICFDGGWPHAPHRVLRGATLEMWEAAGCPPPGSRPGEGEVIGHAAGGEPLLRYEDTAPRAGMSADAGAMALYAGMGVGGVTDLPGAAELAHRLWREASAYLSRDGGTEQTACHPGRNELE